MTTQDGTTRSDVQWSAKPTVMPPMNAPINVPDSPTNNQFRL